ncbi:unnamed protein product, partial [Ectocarpus sp. 8 AP-2014]
VLVRDDETQQQRCESGGLPLVPSLGSSISSLGIPSFFSTTACCRCARLQQCCYCCINASTGWLVLRSTCRCSCWPSVRIKDHQLEGWQVLLPQNLPATFASSTTTRFAGESRVQQYIAFLGRSTAQRPTLFGPVQCRHIKLILTTHERLSLENDRG